MSASWISEAAVVDWLVKSTALIALAWIAAWGARKFKASAALRHLLWLLAMGSAIALPLLAMLTPVRLAVLPALFEPTIAQKTGAPAPVAWTFVDAMLAVYACVAALFVLRIVIGQWRLNTVWRRSLQVDSIQRQADTLAEVIGLARAAAVRVADHASAPMTWGFLRAKIVLPAEAVGWPMAQRRLVLMHELAHVARADSFTQLLTSVALALSWFQPALWFAAARMRREQEHACDDRVLLAGASPDAYARTLLDVAAGRFGGVTPAAVMMAAPSQLEARLTAIIAERPRVISCAGAAVAMTGACIVLAAAAIAAPAPKTPRVPAVAPVAPISIASPEAQLLGASDATPAAPVAPVTPVARTMRTPSVTRAPRVHVTAPTAPTPSSFVTPVAAPAPVAHLATVIAPTAPTLAVAPTPSVPPTAVVAPTPVTPVTPVTPAGPPTYHRAPRARSP